MELIDGHLGSPHIDSTDMAIIHRGTRGPDSYVFGWGDQCKATVQNANEITIGTGCGSIQGLDWCITAPETLNIDPGSQGMSRNDIIAVEYDKDSTGVQTAKLVVIKGTPSSGTAVDPQMPSSGDVIAATMHAYQPLWRIPISGVTVGTPVQLYDYLVSMDEAMQPIVFDRSGLTTTGDDMSIVGYVTTIGSQSIATVSIRWVNKGSFTSQSWTATNLAKMVGWSAAREAYMTCSENIQYGDLGKNSFRANERFITYMTPGTLQIPGGSWHNGGLIFPVVKSS